MARETSGRLFENGLIVETCGVDDQVLKLLPPLYIEIADLKLGLMRSGARSSTPR